MKTRTLQQLATRVDREYTIISVNVVRDENCCLCLEVCFDQYLLWYQKDFLPSSAIKFLLGVFVSVKTALALQRSDFVFLTRRFIFQHATLRILVCEFMVLAKQKHFNGPTTHKLLFEQSVESIVPTDSVISQLESVFAFLVFSVLLSFFQKLSEGLQLLFLERRFGLIIIRTVNFWNVLMNSVRPINL